MRFAARAALVDRLSGQHVIELDEGAGSLRLPAQDALQRGEVDPIGHQPALQVDPCARQPVVAFIIRANPVVPGLAAQPVDRARVQQQLAGPVQRAGVSVEYGDTSTRQVMCPALFPSRLILHRCSWRRGVLGFVVFVVFGAGWGVPPPARQHPSPR